MCAPGLWDTEKMRIDMTQYRPLARLYGNFYASLERAVHPRAADLRGMGGGAGEE